MSIVDARLAEIFEWNVETLMYDRHMSIFTVHVDISVIVTHLPKIKLKQLHVFIFYTYMYTEYSFAST